jgi:hypothetical protein
MRASLLLAGVLLVMAFAAPAAHAQCYVPYIPKAPDACGLGNYAPNLNGLYYGPNYCVFPPFSPYNGELPCPPNYAAGAATGMPGANAIPGANPEMLRALGLPLTFPSHPFARGPRDFFMY